METIQFSGVLQDTIKFSEHIILLCVFRGVWGFRLWEKYFPIILNCFCVVGGIRVVETGNPLLFIVSVLRMKGWWKGPRVVSCCLQSHTTNGPCKRVDAVLEFHVLHVRYWRNDVLWIYMSFRYILFTCTSSDYKCLFFNFFYKLHFFSFLLKQMVF